MIRKARTITSSDLPPGVLSVWSPMDGVVVKPSAADTEATDQEGSGFRRTA